MPVCPWNHLIVFIFGAGASILCVSLVGTVAYNGKFGDDNKFLKFRYGWDTTINLLALCNVSLGFICCVLVMLAIGMSVKQLPQLAQLIFWVLAMLAFLGTIISQALTLNWTTYGDAKISSLWNYLKNDDFKEYVEKNWETKKNYTKVDDFLPEKYHNGTDLVGMITSRNYSFDYFLVPYYDGDNLYSVPSCKLYSEIESDKFLVGSFLGYDPCNFVIAGNTSCIGGWTPENFRNYWCFLSRQSKEMTKEMQDMSESEKINYQAIRKRDHISVDSYSAFYEINAIFIGLNISGFVIVIIALFLNMIIRPFDTKTTAYEKVVSESGEASKSSNKGKKSGSGSASASKSKSNQKK